MTKIPVRMPALFAAIQTVMLFIPVDTLAQTGSGGKEGEIEKCEREFGSLAVVEPQSQILAMLQRYQLGSPATMLRMIVQESGCFAVVERGIAFQNLQQERQIAAAGMLQEGSNIGGGQLQAADFVMTPSVQFADETGGMGATVGNFLGRFGGTWGALGGLAGGVKFKEAETTLLVADVRSGIQVASAEGKASKMDFSLGGWGWGAMGWASAGGYSKTPEGKLIAASLLDNFNRIVQNIRSRPSLIRNTSVASQQNAQMATRASPLATGTAQGPLALAPTQAVNASNHALGTPLPAGFLGNFVGQFSGQDNGSFNAVVASNGVISGSGYSSKYQSGFIASGFVSAIGEMQMSGAGQAGAATFKGQIDPESGIVVGQWFWVSGEGKGLPGGGFQGRKQR